MSRCTDERFPGLSRDLSREMYRSVFPISDSETSISLQGVKVGSHRNQQVQIPTGLQPSRKLVASQAVAEALYSYM